jgi:hypothetical protein
MIKKVKKKKKKVKTIAIIKKDSGEYKRVEVHIS